MLEQEFEYKVTVIIPVYNVENYLAEALESLLAQTIPQEEMEVLMINDGSTDGSAAICQGYVEKHENFKLISQENQGVSAARNNGIRNAKGKYLLYLDGDDVLSSETIKNVTDFFDAHYDEVDVVGYPRVFWYEDKSERPHNRDKIIKETKVYALDEIPYVSFSTLNVAIKNLGNRNVLFDNALAFHEDEAYVTEIIIKRKKTGYVREGKYLYRKHGNGVTDRLVNPYYIFEPTMDFYEKLFEKNMCERGIDPYIQTLVLNDFGWKLGVDAFYPYHYTQSKREAAAQRIENLLNQIADELILNHPNIDIYHRFYLLSLKNRDNLHLLSGTNAVVLCRRKHVLRMERRVTIVFSKVKIEDDYVEWWGFLKSPFFLFSSIPDLYTVITRNGEKHEEPLHLMESAFDYYKSKIRTARFWQFHFRVNSNIGGDITFKVLLDGNPIDYSYYFMIGSSFKTNAKYQVFSRHGTQCIKSNKRFTIEKIGRDDAYNKNLERWYWENNKKFWLVRKLAVLNYRSGKRVWLYCDSKGVGKDNGYYQFIHDVKHDDGIKRYYVTHDEYFAKSDAFDGISPSHVVLFGTKRHKFLYLQSEKVITAYIEQYNYLPFDLNTYGHYRDINEPEIIYLQHGVLHAHQPTKYSLEKLNIDREIVSTYYEVKNLIQNYHFQKEYLIPTGMPRYDYIDTDKTAMGKRILMAPSWRQYLITASGTGDWFPEYNRFITSEFYKVIRAFLDSEELAALLEEYDYTIDLKLHPIFGCYRECFLFSNSRIRLAEENVKAEEYSAFISDYSSFVFDFVYLKRPIFYFFPDYDMFKAGLMSYRQLDIPLEEGFGPLAQTAEEAVSALRVILENGGRPEPIYQQRMENFFLYYDDGQCERIYHALMEKRKTGIEENVILKDLLKSQEASTL